MIFPPGVITSCVMNPQRLRFLDIVVVSTCLFLAAPGSCRAVDQDKKIVVATEQNDGEKILLAKDAQLVVKLPSQPGTGYGWRVGESGLLRALGKAEIETPSEGVPGQKERQVFRFRAQASGSSFLELQYVREWEANAKPAKTFRLQVEIEG
jgi:inhibitor of cysteine peptidase